MKMLWLVTATLMLTVVFSEGKTIRCKCWDGYKPQIDKDGPHCFGVKLTHIMPCNLPQPPRCVCTGSVNNILKDSTGTWCTTVRNIRNIFILLKQKKSVEHFQLSISLSLKFFEMFLPSVLLLLLFTESGLGKKSCICWDGFQIEKHDDGTSFCRGINSNKLFNCNLEQPPPCRCMIRNIEVHLDVGEDSCFFAECDNKEEWKSYKLRNPYFHALE
ncbi:hypothetical protein WA026_002954 [Henosepilachna vigintioctopunctata]|uniref:Secreted protein n=1 Tax=Henosepilachna vigintioctopunctata TaxID=420089 RepID=A0AAW1TQ03_9CUCU